MTATPTALLIVALIVGLFLWCVNDLAGWFRDDDVSERTSEFRGSSAVRAEPAGNAGLSGVRSLTSSADGWRRRRREARERRAREKMIHGC